MPWQKLPEFPDGTPGGACYLCKSARRNNEESVYDTSIHIDFEGWLVLCEGCVGEVADLAGWIHPSKAARLADEVKVAQVAQAKAEANWRRADHALEALQTYHESEDD